MRNVHPFLRSGPRWRRPFALVAALAAGWCFALTAAAQEVKVFSADVFQPVVRAMAPVFEKRTGHKLVVVDGASGALAGRIRAGEEFDLAVLPPAVLEELGKEGAVSDGSITPLAKAGGAQGGVYAGAVSAAAANSQAALSLLILLSSEETQPVLKQKGLAAP